jgi:putative CocE/NonD family hydrolase
MSNLSQPHYEVTVDKQVMIPMRDGTHLAADIYRPNAEGCFPAVVERTPYNREESVILRTQTPQYLAERGYVFVVQDVRGRFGSEGTWYPFRDDGVGENQDGYDTLAWIAEQHWCNGKVGTAGGSYAGQTQMLLAPTRPPSLACCFVREAASNLAQQWVYRDGALEWAFNFDWSARHAAFAMQRQIDLIQKSIGYDPRRFEALPLGQDPMLAEPYRWLHDILAHPDDGPFWDPYNFEKQYHRIDAPIYHMAGWFDVFLDGSLRNFIGLVRNGRSKETRHTQKLIIGPWTHGPTVHDPAFARFVGDMDFGPDAALDFNLLMLRWYDHWLKDIDTGILNEPPVRYYLMGANEWRSAEAWPPLGTQEQRFYLHSEPSGSAESLYDGSLSLEKPGPKEKPNSYRYDPADPVPTLGGNTLYWGRRQGGVGEENPDFASTAGPRDQRPVEPRCLTYTSEVLETDLDVVGPVALCLFAATDCVDTDFVAKLCDVFPDGRSMLVTDGILRARYRKGRDRPKLLKPGKVYYFEVDLWSTAWRFAAGHRLRLAITSSNFPRFDRNLNTGADPTQDGRFKIATNTVYHDKDYPSHLSLAILA